MAAMSLFTVACVEDPAPYEQGEPDAAGCYGVYFPAQEAAGAHTYDPNMPAEVEITVARKVTTGAITVPVAYKESHEGIFEVPDAVFEDGQTETTIKVTFPKSGIGTNYQLSLAIDDPKYASKYQDGNVHLDFSVLRVEWVDFLNPKTNKPAVVTFNQGWWGQVHQATIRYYEVDGVRTCVATCIEKDADGNPIGIWGDTQGITFNFTWYTKTFETEAGTNVQYLDVERQYLGFDYADWASKPESEASQGVYFYDWFHYLITDGGYAGGWPDWEGFLEKNPGAYARSYYDINGGFYFNLRYQVPALGGGFSSDEFDVVAIADGFTRVDYSLNVEADYCEAGAVPVFFEAGADVKAVNYVVAAGKVNSVDMAELLPKVADGSAENVVKVAEADMTVTEDGKSFAVDITCPATGQYTLVAVALDAEGKAQADASVVFDYVAATDDSKDVDFSVFAEKTHERYVADGLTEYNSFAYTIYGGNGATAVHVGVYDSATVEKYGEAVVISDVRASKYALDEDAVAAVNSVAGYSDIVSGLKDGTSYTLVVWATNGILTKAEFVEFTTTKSPEVFKSLGKGTYTEDFLAGLFEGMENLTYEVEIQESVDNPGKYRLVNPYGAAYPYNEPGDYDDTQDYYMVINAQDPEGVYIPLQGVGCDWGYGEWTVYSMAANYLDAGYTLADAKAAGQCGTLKDGVITFPVKSLLITADGLGGKIYYANQYGAFKVVLPGYADAAPEEGGAETASVSKSSVKTVEPAFDRPMTSGYFTGIDYTENIVTVSFEAVPSQAVKKNSSRYSTIERISAPELR